MKDMYHYHLVFFIQMFIIQSSFFILGSHVRRYTYLGIISFQFIVERIFSVISLTPFSNVIFRVAESSEV